jgi:choline monooxygenase
MSAPSSPVTLPALAYHDPEWYRRERATIFSTRWQLAGFRAQLQQPGDVVTHTIAGTPVLVLVDGAGALCAFHNVCRHRAGAVVDGDRRGCAALVCGYHGWTYALDGSLTRARDFGHASDFVAAEYGLLPVAVAEWRGLVFVRLALDGPALLDELGALVDRCADRPMETLHYGHRAEHVVECNWKTYTDNYGEGYHVPLVHPELHRQIDSRRYEVRVFDGWAEHTAPTRDGAVSAGLWLWRYPNLGLNLYPDAMNVERWIPEGPTRTRITYDFFFADPSAAAVNAAVEALGTEVLDEDRRICEVVQRNLEAGMYDTGRLSPKHEVCVAAFHSWVRAAVGDA